MLIPISLKVNICPTNPHVPIPAPAGVLTILKRQVPKGAIITEASVVGNNI